MEEGEEGNRTTCLSKITSRRRGPSFSAALPFPPSPSALPPLTSRRGFKRRLGPFRVAVDCAIVAPEMFFRPVRFPPCLLSYRHPLAPFLWLTQRRQCSQHKLLIRSCNVMNTCMEKHSPWRTSHRSGLGQKPLFRITAHAPASAKAAPPSCKRRPCRPARRWASCPARTGRGSWASRPQRPARGGAPC